MTKEDFLLNDEIYNGKHTSVDTDSLSKPVPSTDDNNVEYESSEIPNLSDIKKDMDTLSIAPEHLYLWVTSSYQVVSKTLLPEDTLSLMSKINRVHTDYNYTKKFYTPFNVFLIILVRELRKLDSELQYKAIDSNILHGVFQEYHHSTSQISQNIYPITHRESESNQNDSSNKLYQKEMSMNNHDININLLKVLADKTVNDDLNEFNLGIELPENISKHLRELQDTHKEAASKNAAMEIYNLLQLTKNNLVKQVSYLREARKRESFIKSSIVSIERARIYGLETNNFIPLTNLLGLTSTGETVPDSYKPKDEAVKVVKKTVKKKQVKKTTTPTVVVKEPTK